MLFLAITGLTRLFLGYSFHNKLLPRLSYSTQVPSGLFLFRSALIHFNKGLSIINFFSPERNNLVRFFFSFQPNLTFIQHIYSMIYYNPFPSLVVSKIFFSQTTSISMS